MVDSDPALKKDRAILDRITEGDMSALAGLYEQNRETIRSLVRSNSGTRPEADEILHEALIVLWQRIRAGRFELRAQLGTFVYATAQNLWRRRLARRRKEPLVDPGSVDAADETVSVLDDLAQSELAEAVRDSLEHLSEPCRSLLIAFYWEECSMAEIALRFRLANADTAKAKKYQCKEQLRKILKGIV